MSLTSRRAPDGNSGPVSVTVVNRSSDPISASTAEALELHIGNAPPTPTPFVPNIPDIALNRGRGEAPPGTARDGLEPNDLDDHSHLAGEDDKTGVAGLETIDLLGETVRLFRQTKRLLSKVLVDNGTPVNQKAQVASTLGTLLKTLSAQQTELYNAERLKRLEAITIRLVRDLAPELQDRFMADYEREVNLRDSA